MKKLVIILSVLFMVIIAQGQSDLTKISKDLVYYSDIVANAYLPSSKQRAQEKLIVAVETFLSAPNSYDFDFEEMIWLSIKQPEDLSFKIYTWELDKGEDGYEYYGYIQYPDGTFDKLSDKSDEMDDIEYMGLDKDYWYGALYYNIISTKDAKGKPAYILFGINKEDKYTNHKVAEVLTIDAVGDIVFGSELFFDKKEGDSKQRLHLTYSSDSNVTLNYNSGLGMIVFDNLISRMGMLPGQGPTQLPDGSYKGYTFEDGKWVYVDKIYNQISESVPNAKTTIPRSEKPDLFGRKN